MAKNGEAMAQELEPFIKTRDLVQRFGGKLTPEYVSTLVKQGKIPAYRFNPKGHLFFKFSEVEAVLRIKVAEKAAELEDES